VRAKATTASGIPAAGGKAPDRGEEFVAALESASRGIRDPVAKLKYIRSSLARYQAIDYWIGAVPSPPLRRAAYRWLSLEGLRHLMTTNAMGAPVVDSSTRRAMFLTRGFTAAALLAVVAGVAAAMHRPAQPPAATPVLAATAPTLPPVAEALAPLPAGVKPTQVWIVEKGDGFEQLSNGLRIDTTFAVAGDPRRYRTFARDAGLRDGVGTKPVGLLFHTSESDIWPLEAANNEKLRDSSHHLLRYVQRLRLYNYLIDRFGRVFRVVEEDGKANHAGNAVWEKDGIVYLNLNNAFLGICFETRWDGGRALPITAAQLSAGRSLTEYLQLRFDIPGDMCSTHGLASVNPTKHLIGHHVDWARGFPFQAFGLPDQYARQAPSVALFGFGYDDDFLKVLGEPWPGVRDAEQTLTAEASRSGRALDDVRREKRALYDRWHAEQTKDEEEARDRRRDAELPVARNEKKIGG
jgi:hypothetical protein